MPIDDNPDARAIIAGVQRMLDESRAIDTRAALEGIKANPRPPRNRRIPRRKTVRSFS